METLLCFLSKKKFKVPDLLNHINTFAVKQILFSYHDHENMSYEISYWSQFLQSVDSFGICFGDAWF